jgi:hypothetical protein
MATMVKKPSEQTATISPFSVHEALEQTPEWWSPNAITFTRLFKKLSLAF